MKKITLDDIIELARKKRLCVCIYVWDIDIGMGISFKKEGCGDEYKGEYFDDADDEFVKKNIMMWLKNNEI